MKVIFTMWINNTAFVVIDMVVVVVVAAIVAVVVAIVYANSNKTTTTKFGQKKNVSLNFCWIFRLISWVFIQSNRFAIFWVPIKFPFAKLPRKYCTRSFAFPIDRRLRSVNALVIASTLEIRIHDSRCDGAVRSMQYLYSNFIYYKYRRTSDLADSIQSIL